MTGLSGYKYFIYNTYNVYISIIVGLIMRLTTTTTSVLATANSDAYDSGYDHGCDDSDFEYPGDRYINQPGNGSSKQSDEFMNGYEDGFNACNDKGYENTSNFPELDQGERYGTCEERSIGLVCDIEENRK